jgi:diketogulonate reductase-like aldo/keto reductase
MNYLTTDENMPTMIYGTAWKKDQTANLVTTALLSGFRGIDTAGQPKHYQEHLVGDGLLKAYESGLKREDVYIQTKFTPIDGQDINNMPYHKESSLDIQIEESFQSSKKNLKTDFIDSYILHSPLFPTSKLQLVWNTMENFFTNNEVRRLGISNCYDLDVLEYLYNNSKIKPAIVQNRFYEHTNYDKEIRTWCKGKGIIYQSFWTLTANPHLLNSDVLNNLAEKYSKTSEQIFYRYLTQVNIVPLIGTTSKEHMIEDLAIFEFELETTEVEAITKLL